MGARCFPSKPRGLRPWEDKMLGVSWASWPPDGDLGAHWLLAVGRELLLARKPWKAET